MTIFRPKPIRGKPTKSAVDEMLANRTNRVWRIGRVEYTPLAEKILPAPESRYLGLSCLKKSVLAP